MTSTKPGRRAQTRAASLLLVVLACLTVASALLGSAIRSAASLRRETTTQHRLRQAEFLLEAGAVRAVTAFREDDSYDGETWRPGDSLSGFADPTVKIEVDRAADANSVRLEVTATLGGEGHKRVRRRHSFSLPLTGPSGRE